MQAPFCPILPCLFLSNLVCCPHHLSGAPVSPGQDLLDFYDAHISSDRIYPSIPKRGPPLDDLDGTRLKRKRNNPEKKEILRPLSPYGSHPRNDPP